MCYGERRSKGRGVTISRFEKLVAAKSEVLSVRLQVVALGLGGSAWASHTPAPLERGVSGYNFEELVAARRYLSGFRWLL